MLITHFIQGQAPNSTATTTVPSDHQAPMWHGRHGHGWRIAGVVIWLAVVIYGLILATRFVRAVERIANRERT
jgi:hypothetical protein